MLLEALDKVAIQAVLDRVVHLVVQEPQVLKDSREIPEIKGPKDNREHQETLVHKGLRAVLETRVQLETVVSRVLPDLKVQLVLPDCRDRLVKQV